MQIVMIHGQNHRGSTYHIGKMVADALGGTVTEFFLPRDFGSFCVGCNNCFMKDESLCPHHAKLKPITDAMDDADVLILTSPVYVYHATGAMKAFLDHYGYRWMVHRPEPAMFHKQAVCVTTAAGAGMRSTLRDMQDSLFFWGVPKVYRIGKAVHAVSWAHVSETQRRSCAKQADAIAKKILRKKKVHPGLKTKGFFHIMRMIQKSGSWNETDTRYWKEKGWMQKGRPWK